VAKCASAVGTTTLLDAGELREDRPDRLTGLAGLLRSFGVGVEERPDGLVIEGVPERPLRAARVSGGGDHRLTMAAVVLGLVADGETVIDDADAIQVSFPRFVGTLRSLGADIEVKR
jgi:3-phosphoshikimate 1-carboxyvinyltransferase